jgi:hypothetical protein
MSTSCNPIWKINLFNRFPDNKVECIECKSASTKSASKGNFEFKISDGSVKSLIVHLQSKAHKDSEFHKKYLELTEKPKATRTPSGNHEITSFFTATGQ